MDQDIFDQILILIKEIECRIDFFDDIGRNLSIVKLLENLFLIKFNLLYFKFSVFDFIEIK